MPDISTNTIDSLQVAFESVLNHGSLGPLRKCGVWCAHDKGLDEG